MMFPFPGWTGACKHIRTRGNPILEVLSHCCGVDRKSVPLAREEFVIEAVRGLRRRALPVAGKPAPYSPNRAASLPGDNVALLIEDENTDRRWRR